MGDGNKKEVVPTNSEDKPENTLSFDDNIDARRRGIVSIFDKEISKERLFRLIRGVVGQKRSLNTPPDEILRRYHLCFQTQQGSPITENLWTEMRTWIKEERYYVRLLGSTYSDAFPDDKIFNKKKQDLIVTEIRQSTLPKNTILVGTPHEEKYMNHLGLIGMTRDEAIAFMKKILPEYVS